MLLRQGVRETLFEVFSNEAASDREQGMLSLHCSPLLPLIFHAQYFLEKGRSTRSTCDCYRLKCSFEESYWQPSRFCLIKSIWPMLSAKHIVRRGALFHCLKSQKQRLRRLFKVLKGNHVIQSLPSFDCFPRRAGILSQSTKAELDFLKEFCLPDYPRGNCKLRRRTAFIIAYKLGAEVVL